MGILAGEHRCLPKFVFIMNDYWTLFPDCCKIELKFFSFFTSTKADPEYY
jgi:hypothetical protein